MFNYSEESLLVFPHNSMTVFVSFVFIVFLLKKPDRATLCAKNALLQCTTLVHNTVVMVTITVNGKH